MMGALSIIAASDDEIFLYSTSNATQEEQCWRISKGEAVAGRPSYRLAASYLQSVSIIQPVDVIAASRGSWGESVSSDETDNAEHGIDDPWPELSPAEAFVG